MGRLQFLSRVFGFVSFGFLLLVFSVLPSSAEPPYQDASGQIAYGETVEGELTANASHTWTFSGEIGQRVVISAERFPPNPSTYFDPYLELINSSGEVIAEDDDRGASQDALLLGFSLPDSGTYTIRVSNKKDPWTAGTYRLSLAADTLPADCPNWEGAVVQMEWPSSIAREDLRYRVYLPPCHAELGYRYPYILLLHGSASDDAHWDRLGMDDAVLRGVALGRYPPVALVMPFGGTLANTNTFGENASYEYMLLNELLPEVEDNFCVQNTTAGRAIGGISRGGFWAYFLSLRHLDYFSAVGGHSPFFDEYHAPPTYNPLDLATTVVWEGENLPRLYMDRGQNDYAQLNIDLMDEHLTANDIPHDYQLFEVGQHQDAYWAAHVDDYLSFYTANWSIDDYPPCLADDAIGQASSIQEPMLQ